MHRRPLKWGVMARKRLFISPTFCNSVLMPLILSISLQKFLWAFEPYGGTPTHNAEELTHCNCGTSKRQYIDIHKPPMGREKKRSVPCDELACPFLICHICRLHRNFAYSVTAARQGHNTWVNSSPPPGTVLLAAQSNENKRNKRLKYNRTVN